MSNMSFYKTKLAPIIQNWQTGRLKDSDAEDELLRAFKESIQGIALPPAHHLYRVILTKDVPNPNKLGSTLFEQYGLLVAKSEPEAQDKARAVFEEKWKPQGWSYYGVFYVDYKPLQKNEILWL